MYEFIIATIILIQSVTIIIGSIIVLQKVLHKCSAGLRLAFIVFPIGASLEFMDVLYLRENHLSSVVLNAAIILTIIWMWTQRVLISDLEKLLYNEDKPCNYSIKYELKVIVTSFAVWILRRVNNDQTSKCTVCHKILL
jgi:hypothetical protein